MEMGVERGDMVWCGVVERIGEGFVSAGEGDTGG